MHAIRHELLFQVWLIQEFYNLSQYVIPLCKCQLSVILAQLQLIKCKKYGEYAAHFKWAYARKSAINEKDRAETPTLNLLLNTKSRCVCFCRDLGPAVLINLVIQKTALQSDSLMPSQLTHGDCVTSYQRRHNFTDMSHRRRHDVAQTLRAHWIAVLSRRRLRDSETPRHCTCVKKKNTGSSDTELPSISSGPGRKDHS